MKIPNMRVITESADLAAACAPLHGADFVTVDTEFLRETTYYPQLCLVQLAGPDDAFIVDPLAEGIDLKPLYDLMADPAVLKVFHAARQDIEIFVHRAGIVPLPIFDTQVAAMVCGFGDSVSYETLVRKVAKATLDKGSRFTDWSRRPLSDRQLRYALEDVTHLRVVYEHIAKMLAQTGRGGWVKAEMAVLEDPGTYQTDPQEAWRRLKARTNSRKFLGIAKAVAAFRETEARRRDLPRNRVLKDEAILEIAANPPRDLSDLNALRGVPRGFGEGKLGPGLLEAVARGLAMGPDELPKLNADEPLPDGLGPLVDLLKVLLKMKAEDAGVAQRLIANTDDLEKLAASDEADIDALSGWRRDIFGNAALALKRGDLALAAKGSKIVLIDLTAPAAT
jgi:ribonuclease D